MQQPEIHKIHNQIMHTQIKYCAALKLFSSFLQNLIFLGTKRLKAVPYCLRKDDKVVHY